MTNDGTGEFEYDLTETFVLGDTIQYYIVGRDNANAEVKTAPLTAINNGHQIGGYYTF